AEQARDLGIVTAHDAIAIDDQYSILHALDEEPGDRLEIGDVDAALGREVFRSLGITSKCHRNADRREIAKADQSGLKGLRGADLRIDQPPDIETEQDDGGKRGVEERGARTKQPAACSELRKQQDWQRCAGS